MSSPAGGTPFATRLNAYISIVHEDGARPVLQCRCGHILGAATENYRALSREARFPVQRVGPHADPHGRGTHRFELREYYCPGCLVLIETDVALQDDPLLHDIELDADGIDESRTDA
jgi:N-methylhydantoinase B